MAVKINYTSKVMPEVYELLHGIMKDAHPKPLYSFEVVDAVKAKHPDKWDYLVNEKKYDQKKNYSAATFICDKLSNLKSMGILDVEEVTDGFDKKAWPYSKTMGRWSLKTQLPTLPPEIASVPMMTRLPGDAAAKVKEKAKALAISESAVIAQIVSGYLAIDV